MQKEISGCTDTRAAIRWRIADLIRRFLFHPFNIRTEVGAQKFYAFKNGELRAVWESELKIQIELCFVTDNR